LIAYAFLMATVSADL